MPTLLHFRKLLCIVFITSLSTTVLGQQPVIKPDDDPANKGGTVSTTTTTTGDWTTKTEEKKNKDGKRKDITITSSTPDNRVRRRIIMFDEKGDTSYVFYSIFDRFDELTYSEVRRYEGKKLVKDETKWFNQGEKKYRMVALNLDGTYSTYGEKQAHTNWDQSQPEPDKQPYVCEARNEVEIDYNYLNLGQGGGERLSVPLGARVNYEYNLTNRLSLDAEVTYNVLKEDDIRQMWLFLLFGTSYKFVDEMLKDKDKYKQRCVVPYGEIRIGAVQHRYKYIDPLFLDSKDWNITGALGGGVDIKIGTQTKINFGGDYLPIWYDGKMESNFRLYGGLQYNFGCR